MRPPKYQSLNSPATLAMTALHAALLTLCTNLMSCTRDQPGHHHMKRENTTVVATPRCMHAMHRLPTLGANDSAAIIWQQALDVSGRAVIRLMTASGASGTGCAAAAAAMGTGGAAAIAVAAIGTGGVSGGLENRISGGGGRGVGCHGFAQVRNEVFSALNAH
jgi:hypothetical protein